VDRKKQGTRPEQGEASAVDESWQNLSDGDLVELSEAEDDEVPGELAPVPPRGRPSSAPDLLAPVGPTSTRAAGKTSSRRTLTDLPAPVGPVPRKSIPDLLAPVGPQPSRPASGPPIASPSARSETPSATGASAREATGGSMPQAAARPAADLRPRAARPPLAASRSVPIALPDDIDLPVPVGPLPTKQLPDLLTPVGPTPTRSSSDLPAPKGFFDDGVQPRSRSGVELPAPKGFFDDGVQPRLGAAQVPDAEPGAEPLDVDFFELAESPSRAAARLGAVEGGAGEPAFDLGDPISTGGVNRPFGLDADDLDLERDADARPPPGPLPLELSDAPLSGDAHAPRSRTSRLELGASGEPAIPSTSGPGLTFGKPGAAPDGGRQRSISTSQDPFAPTRAAGHMLTTEIQLEVDPLVTPGAPAMPTSVVARKAPAGRAAVAPRRRADLRSKVAARRRLLLLGGTLLAAALAAASYTASNWWKGERSRDARAASEISQVAKLLADDSPRHWEEAATIAKGLSGEGGENLEALAVVAEASFAAALDESPRAQDRVKEGDRALGALRSQTAKGPHAGKAEALRDVLSTNFAGAVKLLEDLKHAAPTDLDTDLYLGWALAAAEQHGKAVAAFQAGLGSGKPRIPALYGLGLSQIELGDKPAATKSFETVIQTSRDRYKRDHLGALIGLAQLAPVSERDSRYQELLARPDLAAAPPRAVSRLRALAGDEALRAGRVDQARARYEEARALDPLNLRAAVGIALVAARAGDMDGARKRLTEVLGAAPDHIEAALALIEVAMAEKQRDEADEIVDALFARRPPIANATLLGRAHLARARVYETTPDPTVQAKAEGEYREAIARADQGDFAASIGMSALLVRLGRKAEALGVLGPIKAAAQQDVNLALTLGSAYLSAGQADVAAQTFRAAVARRPNDAEARFQLGRACLAIGKFDEAVDSLRRAYDIDPAREDVGLGLARTLEAAGRSRDAVAAYQKMLAADRKPSLTVRGQAGRAFARFGMAAEAAAQGDSIRREDVGNPAGQFLLGETLYGKGKYEDAIKAYREAARLESEAQYFEALGRTSEKLGQLDDALHSYGDAIAADPNYLAPRLGRGRVRLARREFGVAVSELEAAQKVAPNSSEVMRDLGRAHLAMRDVTHAVPLLERAVAMNEHDPETHYALGTVYYDIDRTAAAAQHLGRAVELSSDDVPWRGEAFRLLGWAQRASHNRAGAISAWRRYLAIERKDGPERRDTQRMLMRLEAR
jgi:tetratricopeptide (TPR) repeat protein